MFLSVQPLLGQTELVDSLRNKFDQMYGLDVVLTNGRKYFPDSNPVVGHPFWRNNDFFLGDITISGKTYFSRKLKYDLNKQDFILFYRNLNGQDEQIILPNAEIDSVRTTGYLFIPNRNQEIRQRFVQLLYSGKLSCYIGWHKELEFNTTGVTTGYKYNKESRTYYLVRNDQVHRFTNKSSFLKIFSGHEKNNIRRYLKSSNIKFRKIDDYQLRNLLEYSDKLS